MASRIFKSTEIKGSSKEDNPFMLPCIKHLICDDSISNDKIVNYIYDILPVFYKLELSGNALRNRFDYLKNYVEKHNIRDNFTLPTSVETTEGYVEGKCINCYSSICGGIYACEGCPRNKKYIQSSLIKDEELLMKYLLENENKFNKYFPSIKDIVSDIFVVPVDLNCDVKDSTYIPFFRILFPEILIWISENTAAYFNTVNGSSRDLVMEQCFSYLYGKYGNPGEIIFDNIKSLLSDVLYGYAMEKTGWQEEKFNQFVKSRLNKEYLPKDTQVFEIGEQQSLFNDIDLYSGAGTNVAYMTPTTENPPTDNTVIDKSATEDVNTAQVAIPDTEISTEYIGDDEHYIIPSLNEIEQFVSEAEEYNIGELVPQEMAEDTDSNAPIEENSSTEVSEVEQPAEKTDENGVGEVGTKPDTEESSPQATTGTSVLDELDILSGSTSISSEETSTNEESPALDKRPDNPVADNSSVDKQKKTTAATNSDRKVSQDIPFIGEDNYIIDNKQSECLEFSMDLSQPGAIMSFENAILKDRFMSIEAIVDDNGREILIFRSRRGAVPFFHVYMDNKNCLEYISPYLSKRSFLKICYQPYYLYSYCRKYKVPLKRVYSICTCHSLLVTEYTAENARALKVLSYRKTLESYISEEWKDNLPALLAGMSVYAYVTKQQERRLQVVEQEGFSEQSMLVEMDELVYYDEALGLSYKLDNLFTLDTGIKTLFKLSGHNEFEYTPIDSIKTMPAGKFVEFVIDTELTKLEYAHQIVRGVIIDLVENGRFRKINMYIIDARNNRLKLFIPEYYFQHLMTILSSTFTSVARGLGIEHLTYKTIIKKAESSESSPKVPVVEHIGGNEDENEG